MRKVYCGIDIGTANVKVVIASPAEGPDLPMQLLGTGTSVSRGIRHGYITDPKEATKSIREALHRASSAAKVRVRRARVAVGGVGLDEQRSAAEISLTPSGGVVTEQEMERVLRESEKRAAPKMVNRIIAHAVPLEYRVDGAKVFGKPEGLQGTKLAVDTLLITMLTHHHDEIVEAVESAGVEVEGVMASPLAASFVTLTKAQKTAGVALANIGAETLSIIIFEDDTPTSVKVFPIGSADITHAVALALRIPLMEAEQMKRGAVTGSDVPPKRMQDIVVQRLRDMFTHVNKHLVTLGRARLLPAGIVLTGGGSGLTGVAEVARVVLKLPAQISQVGHLPRSAGVDASWAVAYGLCRWAYAEDIAGSKYTLGDVFSNAWDSLKQAVRSLLP